MSNPYLLALALAAGPTVPLYPPQAAVQAAAKDIVTLPPEARCFQRYLWEPRGFTAARAVANRLHWNLLSRQRDFGTPVRVAPGLLRIDAREYDLPLDVWELFKDLDFVFHVRKKFFADGYEVEYWPGGKFKGRRFARKIYRVKVKAGERIARPAPWLPPEIDVLRAECFTEAPVVWAQWALVQSARDISIRNEKEGVGYRDFLRFQNRDQFFDLTGMDPKATLKKLQEMRVAVTRSGVSQQARFVESVRGVNGIGWFTLDFFHDPVVRRNLRRGEAKQDAERHIAPLPNRLPANGLFNGQGLAQDSAPDKLGGDDSPGRLAQDARIHNNKSCWSCHAAWKAADEYTKPPRTDWTRGHFKAPAGAPGRRLVDPDKGVEFELRRQYLSDVATEMADTRVVYRRAVAQVTATTANPRGLSVQAAGKLYVGEINDYIDRPVSRARFARELGVGESRLVRVLRAYEAAVGLAENVLAGYLSEPPEELERLEAEAAYPLAAALNTGVAPPVLIEKRKVKK